MKQKMSKIIFISQGTNYASRSGHVNFTISEQEAQRALAEVDNPRAKQEELEARAMADARQRTSPPTGPYRVGTPPNCRAYQQA